MQDKYSGDIGDFGKYGLLKTIVTESKGTIRLGVNWYYVTREEGRNGDGNRISYLNKGNKAWENYKACFPGLYDDLKIIVSEGRRISQIEERKVLPEETIFYSKPIPHAATKATKRLNDRETWIQESLLHLKKADIVFLDPDNGIQLDVSKKAKPNADKYIFTDEIKAYYDLGKSLIIYNHRDRRPTAEYNRKILRLRSYVDAWDDIKVLRFKRGSVRDFIFLIQDEHRSLINHTIACLTKEPYDFLYTEYCFLEGRDMTNTGKYWTHPSVVAFCGGSDPIELIIDRARDGVMRALEQGWTGPPFDPFKLANYLKVETVPNEEVFDAHTLPLGPSRFKIEYNPNKPRARKRFSVAHELAHTLFPDCGEAIRKRKRTLGRSEDEWQLELLCNIAAAEFLMPIGFGSDLEKEHVSVENILRLQKQYDVSTEAISHRLANITGEPCIIFVATQMSDELDASYRIDYSIPSRSSNMTIPRGFKIPSQTVLSECVAIGFTAKGTVHWGSQLPPIKIECVGIPPYPGHYRPRIVGVARTKIPGKPQTNEITYLRGDALEPRGTGKRIIAHIVNDKTPNWGAGFPLVIKKRWPFVQKDFRDWVTLDRSNLALGNIHSSIVSEEGLIIVHMIAQHGYGRSKKPRIRYGALRICLENLSKIALQTSASIHMPRIGTGQAGGNWWIISGLIDEALLRQNNKVTVYDLPGSSFVDNRSAVLNLFE